MNDYDLRKINKKEVVKLHISLPYSDAENAGNLTDDSKLVKKWKHKL